MKNKAFKIIIITLISTLFCQLGMVLICVNPNSMMHMPTIKSTVMVAMVAFTLEVTTDIALNYIVVYTKKTAGVLTAISAFLILAVIQSILNPLVSLTGGIAYRYPMLAVMGFATFLCEIVARKEKPSFRGLLVKPDFSKPETVFTSILIISGIIMSLIIPLKTSTGWDDDSHYKYTLRFSEGIYTAFNEKDEELIYSWDESAFQDDDAVRVNVESDKFALSFNRVGYLGATLGLWLGQILNLDAFGRFFCGRIGGLLFYSLLVYIAIRKLSGGKLLLGLICLSPICVQYAVCYSYDSWMLGFTAIGFAYFFTEVFNPEEKISARTMIIMIGSLFVGTWVKMPYAVLLWILLLMPRGKFESAKDHKIYVLMILLCFAFEFGYTFMTSFAAGDVVDARGGEGISGYAQVMYIIQNPLKYIMTLLEFLKSYLYPIISESYLSSMIYLGSTNMYIVIIIFMIIFALLDNVKIIKMPVLRVAGIAILLLLVVVVVSTMYIAFTPVASSTILGASSRYKLELLYPFMMLAFSGWIVTKEKTRKIMTYSAYAVVSASMIISLVNIL